MLTRGIPRSIWSAFAVVFVLLAGAEAALADQWRSPAVAEVFSDDRSHFVRVVPGTAQDHVVGFGARPADLFVSDDRYATAEFYERRDNQAYVRVATTTLPNPVAPVAFFVTNDGRLATLDNWHNMGYGVVAAVYTSAGDVVRQYRLTDLFTASEVDAFPMSTSSIHWRSGAMFLRDQATLFVSIPGNGVLLIGLESGAYKFCVSEEGVERCRSTNEDRTWTSWRNTPDPR